MTACALDVLSSNRVLPVVTVHSTRTAIDLIGALTTGGFTTIEITLRTDCALEVIEHASRTFADLTIGAGSVMNADSGAAALAAGARFLVSPGIDDGVIDVARSQGVAVIPGIATATELQRASNIGLSVVKLFPAQPLGGVELIDAFAPVWPSMRFVPTGGISAASAPDYLSRGSVLAVGGSWMAPRDAVEAENWDAVVAASRSACRIGGYER